MRKLLSYALTLLMTATLFCSCSDDDDKDVTIGLGDLPAVARDFIGEYFSGSKVLRVERDGDKDGTEYEVWFTDGYSVEFNALGEWTDVDAPVGMTIPDGIAPEPIVSYMETNYPKEGINELSREYRGYDVETTTGLELLFDLEGNFIGFDW